MWGAESSSLSGSYNISHYVPVVKSNGFIVFYTINGIILKQTAAASFHLGTFSSQKLNLLLCVCVELVYFNDSHDKGLEPSSDLHHQLPGATLLGPHRSKLTLHPISITLLSSAVLALHDFSLDRCQDPFTNSPLSLYLLLQPQQLSSRSGWVLRPTVPLVMQSHHHASHSYGTWQAFHCFPIFSFRLCSLCICFQQYS